MSELTDGNIVTVSPGQAQKRGVAPGGYQDLRPLADDAALAAAVAGYNTGCGNSIISIAVGLSPDYTTTPGPSGGPDYSNDVISRAASFRTKYASL